MAEERTNETTTGANGGAPVALIDRIFNQGKIIRDESQRPYALELVNEYSTQILDQGMAIGKDTVVEGIKDRIAKIDELLSNQLNQIMHDPEFQRLEASWRGLHYLIMNTETST
ncbi:MAG: type VI secretion system contractile sheath domain-containing protein, partial [Terriglobia bacterium]